MTLVAFSVLLKTVSSAPIESLFIISHTDAAVGEPEFDAVCLDSITTNDRPLPRLSLICSPQDPFHDTSTSLPDLHDRE